MVSQLGSRHIARKLVVFEYLTALIEWSTKNRKLPHYMNKFNKETEILANKFKINRKEKDIIVDLTTLQNEKIP